MHRRFRVVAPPHYLMVFPRVVGLEGYDLASRRPIAAANWSAAWYLVSSFAVISYTSNAVYVLFAAVGSWCGAYLSLAWLRR